MVGVVVHWVVSSKVTLPKNARFVLVTNVESSMEVMHQVHVLIPGDRVTHEQDMDVSQVIGPRYSPSSVKWLSEDGEPGATRRFCRL